MKNYFLELYEKWVLSRSWLVLLAVLLAVAGVASFAGNFKLDASADALVLENDKDLKFFRTINRRYGVDDFVVLTWSPTGEVFTRPALARLKKLKNDLSKVEGVNKVLSILDLPLLDSPRITLSDLSDEARTLETPGTDLQLAKREFLNSPLYRDLVLSADGNTTLLLIYLDRDESYESLLAEREDLRDLYAERPTDHKVATQLADVSQKFKAYGSIYAEQRSQIIFNIRQAVALNQNGPRMFLSGVPMIVSDMIDMIRSDLLVFGVSVIAFLVLVLVIIFRRLRWVALPIMCCGSTVLLMIGLLGWGDWRVTVVSSNFVALLLIIAMSMTIHLSVRFRELQINRPDAPLREILRETTRFMFKPCIYTSLTTIVAFLSLVVSGIRPVIDFGYIMTVGIVFAFVIIFLLFPSWLSLLKKEQNLNANRFTEGITLGFANFACKKYRLISLLSLILLVFSALGISQLQVENRFIDYFYSDTEIHRGMLEIDRKLGGTTPLDVVLRMPESADTQQESSSESESEFDDYLDDFENDESSGGYWMNPVKLEEVKKVHDFFEQQPAIGKVMSLAILVRLAEMLNEDQPLNDFDTTFLHNVLSGDIKDILYKPYISEDGKEVRFNMRVIDSDKNLKRADLIKEIRKGLRSLGYRDEDFRINGMLVLYNNMLQSLYQSQILTIGTVFLAIMIMFSILFQSFKLAIIGIFPNMLSAASVLGFMGWKGIPLDMMTITIAAISVGIAVDNTIHYITRFQREFAKNNDYSEVIVCCHKSIGKAMYYTSITIIFGFSILALSNFIPTIYFGILTSIAMFVALILSLTLLPSLLLLFKPLRSRE